jgi:hypothetical protein
MTVLIACSMEVLPKVAAEDPQAVQYIIDLTKLRTAEAVSPRRLRAFTPLAPLQSTRTPFREDGERLLAGLAETHPEHRKQVLAALVDVLNDEVRETKSVDEPYLSPAIAQLESATNALLMCGPEGRSAVTRTAVPVLEDLQFHKSEYVRKAAKRIRQKIADTP